MTTFTHAGIVGEMVTPKYRRRSVDHYFNGPHYVYTLTDPRTNTVRYVGMTDDPVTRRRSLMGTNASKPIGKWMQELSECGFMPMFTIIETTVGRGEAAIREKHWIAHYVLCNGGDVMFNRKGGRIGRFGKPDRQLSPSDFQFAETA